MLQQFNTPSEETSRIEQLAMFFAASYTVITEIVKDHQNPKANRDTISSKRS